MAVDFTLTIDPDLDLAVAKLVDKSDTAIDACNKIAAAARSLAPVDSGDYQSKIKVERFKGGARVLASDYKSSWIEFGGGGNPAQFVLRRAVDSVGLKFKKRRG